MNTVVPAHTGLAAYHVATGDYTKAIFPKLRANRGLLQDGHPAEQVRQGAVDRDVGDRCDARHRVVPATGPRCAPPPRR